MQSIATDPKSSLAESEGTPQTSHHLSRLSPRTIICISVLVSTLLIVTLAVRIEDLYLENHGFFFDPATYYIANIDICKSLSQDGWWSTLVKEITTNTRFPARTIPYLLLAPKLLATTTGHLWTEVPQLFAFLVLFALTIYHRTKSTLLSLGSSLLFLSTPFLLNPILGIGAYWLDLTAACSFGSAALCLIRYHDKPHAGWMFAFGAFSSATALSRWSAASYLLLFVLFAVPITFAGRNRWNLTELRNLGCALLTALPGLGFTLIFAQDNLIGYSTLGYALGSPINKSIVWTGSSLLSMFGLPTLTLLTALSAANAASLFERTRDKKLTVICLWLPISTFVFVCFICKAVDGFHPLVYFGPGLFISAFCPLGRIVLNRTWFLWLCCGLLVLAGTTIVSTYEHFRRVASRPEIGAMLQKQSDSAIASYIVSTHARKFVKFDLQAPMPHLEAFYTHGYICGWDTYFSMHESYMKAEYPQQTAEQMTKSVYVRIKRNVDLVAAFTNSSDACAPGVFTNPYTTSVCQGISASIANDPDWLLLGTVPGPRGSLSIYQNRKLVRDGSKDTYRK